MKSGGTAVWVAVAGSLLLLAGCAAREKPQANLAPALIAKPVPPGGASPDLTVPETGKDGRFSTINSGLKSAEAVWHVRAALNVAALSCSGANGAAITQRYNTLLKSRKQLLADAYRSERARFSASNGSAEQAALDGHMTKLYNFFAQPPAQQGFCIAAASVSGKLATASPANFSTVAEGSLERLEAPILNFYRDYAEYRRELAAWKANPNASHMASTMQAKSLSVAARPIATDWRIQLGAFTGRSAAEAAWEKVKTRLPALKEYRPIYEEVTGRSELVRLQIDSADDRAGALKLCATAAAGGFDCLPVGR